VLSALLVLGLAAAVGYLGQSRVGLGVARGPSLVSAIAVEETPVADRPASRVRLGISISNSGPTRVRVVGAGRRTGTVQILSLDPAVLDVPHGGIADLTADLALSCGASGPLGLPPLLIEREGGEQQALSVANPGLLYNACDRGPEEDKRLRLLGSGRSGTGLRVTLATPSGAPSQVTGIRAGGVRLRTEPAVVEVDGATPVVLRPVGRCPAAWISGGIPRRLDIDVASTGVATLELPAGAALASWILDTSCPARARHSPAEPSAAGGRT
jgi:hypothetical protein